MFIAHSFKENPIRDLATYVRPRTSATLLISRDAYLQRNKDALQTVIINSGQMSNIYILDAILGSTKPVFLRSLRRIIECSREMKKGRA
jgi:hypothetical protein